jgi:hypothetical protein
MLRKASQSSGWTTSSFCDSASCVEVARTADSVLVRNSVDKSGPIVQFTPHEWAVFIEGAKSGEFDLG